MSKLFCPKCNAHVSTEDQFCAKCGNQLISNQQTEKVLEKRVAVFQIISIVTFVISLFSPMLFLNFFVLIVIGSAIISIVRKEQRWGVSAIALLFGVFLLAAPVINKFQEISYIDKVTITNWNWEQERNYSYIRGRIKNNGNNTIRYFKIKAFYLDNMGNVLDTGIDNDLDDLYPGMSKEFQIMHKYSTEYKRVSLSIEEIKIK